MCPPPTSQPDIVDAGVKWDDPVYAASSSKEKGQYLNVISKYGSILNEFQVGRLFSASGWLPSTASLKENASKTDRKALNH